MGNFDIGEFFNQFVDFIMSFIDTIKDLVASVRAKNDAE